MLELKTSKNIPIFFCSIHVRITEKPPSKKTSQINSLKKGLELFVDTNSCDGFLWCSGTGYANRFYTPQSDNAL